MMLLAANFGSNNSKLVTWCGNINQDITVAVRFTILRDL